MLHLTLNLIPIAGLIIGSLGLVDPITVRKLCLAIGSLHILVPGLQGANGLGLEPGSSPNFMSHIGSLLGVPTVQPEIELANSNMV